MNKSEFRKEALLKRNGLFHSSDEKKISDDLILNYFLNSTILDTTQKVLTYVSFRSEVDTIGLINYVLDRKLILAVPRCGTFGKMDFFRIDSLNDLIPSRYGIPEPADNPLRCITEFENTVCIVPGLAFDISGKRMGYGGGYYDRFLSAHPEIITVGLCYNLLLSESVPSESHDISVDYIITEKGLIKING